MAVADGNSTTPLCEMLFQLKPLRICLFLCLPLASPASFNLLITCERLKQSASQNKLSAVFPFELKFRHFSGQYVFGFFTERHEGDEDTETCNLKVTASLTATRGRVRCCCPYKPGLIADYSSDLSDSTEVGQRVVVQ